MTVYDISLLNRAHLATTQHRAQMEASEVCGCFYCETTFPPSEIERWLNEGDGTALCPNCQIDSVIGSASGFPVGDLAFLKAMNERWF